jgi:hypothetical protein
MPDQSLVDQQAKVQRNHVHRRAIAVYPANLQAGALWQGATTFSWKSSVSLPTSIVLMSPKMDVELSELKRSSGEWWGHRRED